MATAAANLIRIMPAEGRDLQDADIEARAVEVHLNGAIRQVQRGTNVATLLALVGLEPRKVAVERNEAIVPRSLYGETLLQPGDRLEIVHFIGGG